MELTKKQEQRILKLYRALKKKNKYVANLYPNPSPPDPLYTHDRAYGNTFLHMAIRYREFELVDLLLQKLPGSLSKIKNDAGDTILHEPDANDDSADGADRVVEKDPESLSNIKNDDGDNILHETGANDDSADRADGVVEKDPESLANMKNYDGDTILHELAANDDSIDRACRFVDKDPEMLNALNNLKETPIFSAARHGRFGTFYALYCELRSRYSENPEELRKCMERDDKTTVLHTAVAAENFRLASFIARYEPDLIAQNDGDGMTALQYLACNQKVFERKEIKGEGFLEDSLLKKTNDKSLKDRVGSLENKRFGLKGLVTTLVENDTAWLREPQSKNFLENETQRCGEIKKSDESPLFLAIMSNISEIVEEIFLQHPSAVMHTNKDGLNILQVAILYGNIGIFDLIKNLDLLPNGLLSVVDKEGNSLLHMVGNDQKGQVDNQKGQVGNKIQNHAMQLRKECILFQKVKEACSMHIIKPLNKNHRTAEELFAAKNEKLHEEAKEWLTRTTENCTILSVFIATVAFAAAYTVPGGPDQNTGIPLLNSKPWFVVFIAADVISLTLALASVGIFLSILTSSFPLQDFEKSVFKKLRRGIISMVLSVSMMAVGFGATIVLAMAHTRESVCWIVVGFLPVPIFFLSYSPLRSAVFGPGIDLLITFAAKFPNWCKEIAFNFLYWYFYGLCRAVTCSFRRICGQKSSETGLV